MKFTYSLTREDYYDFNKFYFIKKKLKSVIIIGIMMLCAFEFFLNLNKFKPWPTLISSLAWVTYYFFHYSHYLNSTKKIPVENGQFLTERTIDFTVDHIREVTSNWESTSSWEIVLKLEESPKSFYLFTDSMAAIFIPKRVFECKADENDFRDFVNKQINVPVRKFV